MAFRQGGRGVPLTPSQGGGHGPGGSHRRWAREDEPGEEGEEGAFRREVSVRPGARRGVGGCGGPWFSYWEFLCLHLPSDRGVRQTDGWLYL